MFHMSSSPTPLRPPEADVDLPFVTHRLLASAALDALHDCSQTYESQRSVSKRAQIKAAAHADMQGGYGYIQTHNPSLRYQRQDSVQT